MIDNRRLKIALAGNPNVGKSTLFNALTGAHQHTGNWAGKTVAVAEGGCKSRKREYELIDLPGTYSLMAHSREEEIARDYLLFAEADAVVVVCDAVCLFRNINLVLQVLEVTRRVVVCVNLLDEAKKKHIEIDLPMLSRRLGVEVVGVVAKKRRTLDALLAAIDRTVEGEAPDYFRIAYPKELEEEIERVQCTFPIALGERLNTRYLAVHMIANDTSFLSAIKASCGEIWDNGGESSTALESARLRLCARADADATLREQIVGAISMRGEALLTHVISSREDADGRDRRIDKILTGRLTAFPLMLLMLAVIFWITIFGANYLSEGLSFVFFLLEDKFSALLLWLGVHPFVHGVLVEGLFRVTGWVISVMLPPMAIFFPLFTLLEDAGYLPRIAYNLDRPFRCSCSCGKQALTMCMGFGCNAVGVSGARIIDSRRERLLAIVTNSFMPCNGRLPTIIALLTIFVVGTGGGFGASILTALLLLLLIVFGVLLTFVCNFALSKTVFRGTPSSFALELPPYRRPDILRVIVRSILDRALHVLGRAVAVAAPVGVLLYILANVTVSGASLLSHFTAFLDPVGRFLGLDGVILAAFLLGFPAGEIVLPIMLMSYLSAGSISELANYAEIREILAANGWTVVTAISVVLFTMFHFPCSTTLITVHRESGSLGVTLLSALLPTVIGVLLCMAVAFVF